MYSARVALDSLSPYTHGHRLTTMILTYPRFVHSEFMTHRMFSRNSASSRAIPVEKMLLMARESPAGPVEWGANQKGMQARTLVTPKVQSLAETAWHAARDAAIEHAARLVELGVHKQIVNRLLEPFLWHTTIVTGIDSAWANFFHLRCHPDAQPEMQRLAVITRQAYRESTAVERLHHRPLLVSDDWAELRQALSPVERQLDSDVRPLYVSAARCARVSYLTHEGKRSIEADLDLFNRLVTGGHWSPLEHVAKAQPTHALCASGNFYGWTQLRKEFAGEFWTTF